MEPIIGQLMLFGGNFAPRGWAFCNGQLLSIAQNSALFSLLGTTYGGDGRTTFGLPDLRGRVPVGMGQGQGLPPVQQGQMAGTPTVTLTSAQMPAHTHGLTEVKISVTNPGYVDIPIDAAGEGDISNDARGVLASGFVTAFSNGVSNGIYSGSGIPVKGMQVSATGGQISPAGNNQAVPIMQPYLGMNYCIALQGIYPSRD